MNYIHIKDINKSLRENQFFSSLTFRSINSKLQVL